MPDILSPQELLALSFLSSLSLRCRNTQLPDATVTSGWHSLRQLDFDLDGGEDATVLEQTFGAITLLPHLESLWCRLWTALPAQLSAPSNLRELKIRLPQIEVYRSLQVSHVSPPGHRLLRHKRRLC